MPGNEGDYGQMRALWDKFKRLKSERAMGAGREQVCNHSPDRGSGAGLAIPGEQRDAAHQLRRVSPPMEMLRSPFPCPEPSMVLLTTVSLLLLPGKGPGSPASDNRAVVVPGTEGTGGIRLPRKLPGALYATIKHLLQESK